MKYTKLRQLPFRPQLTIMVLYLAGLGLVLASMTIAILRNDDIGYYAGVTLELVMVVHLKRRAG